MQTGKRSLKDIEKSLTKTYKKDILRPFVRAINDYRLVEENDRIAVAVSGGKDSLILAKLFQEIRRHRKIDFELVFITMDPGFNRINRQLLEANAAYLGIPLAIHDSRAFASLADMAPKSPCYLCARMRRGFLYRVAKEHGCNKLALAHHFDDVIETTLLNLFYGYEVATMVPKITAKNFSGIELIRPLFYVRERDIERWLTYSGITAMDCACSVAGERIGSKRHEIKELIRAMRRTNRDVDRSIFRAAHNVNLEAILGYKNLDEKKDFNALYEERRMKHEHNE
ncbi:MAG: tRNA 2-thiocytidine biosynthesis TtcA family protein [Acholeplasmataceae bacterium]